MTLLNKFIILILLSLVSKLTLSQSCLPDGIFFSTQSQVDDFQNNYPGCTEIEGLVIVNGYDISNLDGLNMITSIGGNLVFGCNEWEQCLPGLTNLEGLNNLVSIGGDLMIYDNLNLETLNGLDNLATIDSSLYIYENPELTNLNALNNLTFVGKDIYISSNESLNDINGLGNIDASSVNNLTVASNHLLSSCQAQSLCDYLSNPNGVVVIAYNSTGCKNPGEIAAGCGISMNCLPYGDYYFTSQSEIDSFQLDYSGCSVLNGLVWIEGTDISELTGLNIIDSINGTIIIEFNNSLPALYGLENLHYVAGNLDIFGNDSLISLEGLNNLSFIGESLWIKYNALDNLMGLGNLDSLEGDLEIWECGEMTNFEGMDSLKNINGNVRLWDLNRVKNLNGLGNLSTISGSLSIYHNDSLRSTQGLNNLSSIGSTLSIGDNLLLSDLTGLSNLDSIGGTLGISRNYKLKSMSGLDNIDPESIKDLRIVENPMLSECEVQSICDYLASPNGTIEIHDNATGCNSRQEVDSACVYLSIGETNAQPEFSIHPNPSSSLITIETPTTPEKNTLLTIYNISGQQLIQSQITEQQMVVDLSGLSQGVYFVIVKDNKRVIVEKIIRR